MSGEPLFDGRADDFDDTLAHALSATGEGKEYFACARVAWLCRCLDALGVRPRAVMDYGCGTGSATPYLFDLLGAASVTGVDVSPRSLDLATKRWGSSGAVFSLPSSGPSAQCDLVFSNGVFHHIPPHERSGAIAYVYDALADGGWFALWENNPWNPGARYVMAHCAFDREAIMLASPQARRLLRAQGFEVVCTDFLFIFPRALRWLRWLEPFVSRLPLGGQYQVLCRKPAGRGHVR